MNDSNQNDASKAGTSEPREQSSGDQQERRRRQRRHRSGRSAGSRFLNALPIIGPIRAHLRGESFNIPHRGRKRFPDQLKIEIAKGIAIVLITLGLLGGLIYWMTSSEDEGDSSRVVETETEVPLAEMEPARLLVKYNETIIDEEAALPERIATAFERVDIAAAMAKTDDPSISLAGTRGQLEDNAIVALICLDEGMQVNKSVMAFLESARTTAQDDGDDATAALRMACASIVSVVRASESAEDETGWIVASRNFTEAVSSAIDDPTAARLLVTLASVVQNRNMVSPPSQFLATASHAFSGSGSPAVREVSATYMNRFTLAERASMLAARVDSMLMQGTYTPEDYSRLYDAVFQLMRAERFNDAVDIIDRANAEMSLENAPESVAANIKILKHWCSLHLQEFDSTGARTFDDQAPARRAANEDLRVVIFTELDKASQSIGRFNELTAALGPRIQSGEAGITIIILYDSSKPADFEDIEGASRMFPILDFWKVDTNTDEGRAMADRYRTPYFPFVVVLDNRNQITGIEPDARAIGGGISLDLTDDE